MRPFIFDEPYSTQVIPVQIPRTHTVLSGRNRQSESSVLLETRFGVQMADLGPPSRLPIAALYARHSPEGQVIPLTVSKLLLDKHKSDRDSTQSTGRGCAPCLRICVKIELWVRSLHTRRSSAFGTTEKPYATVQSVRTHSAKFD